MQRDIELPPLHNLRASKQWQIINHHVDFEGKSVLDLGCGYADLLWRCWRVGASVAGGFDLNGEAINANHLKCKQLAENCGSRFLDYDLRFFNYDVNKIINCERLFKTNDVIFCFSVLPYLDDILVALQWICSHSKLALIECQTSGDGPGPDWHKTDDDMRHMLERTGWTSINRIGATHVADRDKWRSIWLCEGG